MDPWSAAWKPAEGDAVEVRQIGRSGTIVTTAGDSFLVEYDFMASEGSPEPHAERETGWHSRGALEPGDATLARLRREQAKG